MNGALSVCLSVCLSGWEAAEYDNQRVWFFLVYQYVVFGLIHAFMEVRTPHLEC